MSRANSCEQPGPRWWGLIRHHAIVVIALAAACSKAAPRDHSFDDPAQASSRVRAMVGSCAGLTRVLDQIAAARVSGRLLAGFVDDAIAHAQCDDLAGAVKGAAAAHQLARARLADGHPEAALAELTARSEPAIRLRRAELLDRIGRSEDALHELAGLALDDEAATLRRLLEISVLARAGKHEEVARAIAAAPLPEQPRLAFRAAADAPEDALGRLAQAGTLDLATAAADRLEQLHGPAAALAARERIASLDESRAESWDALGRARIAAGQIDQALAAWDRASDLAPAQPAYRIAPIRALVIAGAPQRAKTRARALAEQARAAHDVELLVTASAGAAAAGDPALAVELARDARSRRTGDGRLAFLVAERLGEAGEVKAAADAYAELLACGAHGRPWHRHEVAGKLLVLAGQSAKARAIVLAAVAASRACTTVEPDDLATYVEGLRERAAQ